MLLGGTGDKVPHSTIHCSSVPVNRDTLFICGTVTVVDLFYATVTDILCMLRK